MKICYLMVGFGFTGGNIVIYNLMNRLVNDGHEVYAVTPEGRYEWHYGMDKELLNSFNIKEPVSMGKKIKNILKKNKAINSLYSKVKTPQPDEIIMNQEMNKKIINNWVPCDFTIATFCTTAFAAFQLSNKTIPVYHMQHLEELFMIGKNDMQMYARQTYSLPINLISNSIWLKNEIRHRFNRETYLLNPAIDDKQFFCRNDVRKKYENVTVWKILNYSDARDFKGLSDNIKVMKQVKEMYGDNVEIIYFGGHNPGEIGFEYKYAGKVFGDNLGQLYSDCHIMFLPSWYESFPLQPLEAQKSGTLIVSTLYGTEDYLTNENSIILLPRDTETMISKFKDIIEGRVDILKKVEKAIETSEKITWENSYITFLSILDEIKKNNIADKFNDLEELVKGEFDNYWLTKNKDKINNIDEKLSEG